MPSSKNLAEGYYTERFIGNLLTLNLYFQSRLMGRLWSFYFYRQQIINYSVLADFSPAAEFIGLLKFPENDGKQAW
jgi:hypothetical protein